MSNLDIAAIREQVRALDFVLGTPTCSGLRTSASGPENSDHSLFANRGGALMKAVGVAIIVSIGMWSTSAFALDDSIIARCFFVYGGMTEAAQENGRPDLEVYAKIRLMYAGGYAKAKENDRDFAQIFDANLDANKRLGLYVKSKMIDAIKNNNQQSYEDAMNIVRRCSADIGLLGQGELNRR